MLIVALVLAVIGLAALVTAVVTSNELIAWVCIAASVIGVVLLIVDAMRERSRGDGGEVEQPTRERNRSSSSTRTTRRKPAAPADEPNTKRMTTAVEQAERCHQRGQQPLSR